tara:strand:- start:2651 stop:3160 length:510 start_codon:yes stop_codon:yes gene_type:complete
MKILSGLYRRISIRTSKKLSYRPTKSLVRKSIFDSLKFFNFRSVCDLFSGSGIIGFESASRGAKSITFVDDNYKSMKLIRENARMLKGPDYNFFQKDVFKFLENCSSYDLIYADPPYQTQDLDVLVKIALKHLKKNGIFILECDKSQSPFLDCKLRDFGRTRILKWENK